MAHQVADKFGIGKRAVNMRRQSAAAVIGEEIDFDCDTPEELERKAAELERKAAERQRAELKVVRLKRRKTEPRGVVEDPTQLAGLRAADIGSKIEDLWKALDAIGRFDAIARKQQHRLIHKFCLGLGLDPLKMAPSAVFGLAEEEPDLDENAPAAVAPDTDDAAVVQAEPGDDGADLGAEDLQAADDDVSGDADDGAAEDADDNVSEAVDQEDAGAEDLQAADEVGEAADQQPGEPTCANCHFGFSSNDPSEVINGRLYHRRDCAEYGRRIAMAA